MTDYTDLKRRLLTFGNFAAERAEAAAAIAAMEAEVEKWRVRVERIRAELIARGADSVGDEASAYNDAALALRVLLDSAALSATPVTGSPR